MKTRFARDNRGVAAVEAAIVIPIFMSLMLAAVDYGSVFYVQHSMNTVANDVSRSVALGQLSHSQAVATAKARLPNWNSANFTVTSVDSGANDIKLTISVAASDAALVNFAPLGLAGTLSVSATKKKM